MNNLYEEIQIIWHGIKERRWIALAIAWAVALLGWLVVALIPNVYQSHARIFVQAQTMLPDKAGMTPLDQQQAIEQVRQTITSAANLDKVVRSTDLGKGLKTDAEVAERVGALKNNIKIVSQQDNLFDISVASADKSLSARDNALVAAQVTAGLIQAFQDTSQAGGIADSNMSLKFLDQQINERAKALQAAEQRRVDFEQANVGILPGAGSIGTRMDSARNELGQIESQLVAAQSALAGINGQLAGTPADIVTPGAGGNSALAQAQAQLATARAQGWTDNHPDVVALKRQIENLRRMPGGGGGTRSPNPLYLSLKSQQSERAAAVAALQARRAQLQGDLNAMTAKQVEEPGLAAEQDRLSRDYNVIKDQYDKLLASREEVRLRGEAQSEGGTMKVRVVDPPSASSMPVSPNRPLLVIGVMVAGIAAGIGAAFALGQFRATFPTTDRLAKATGLPVLGGISAIETPDQVDKNRQNLRWFYSAGAGLAGLCVVLLAVEFIQRGLNA